MKEITINNTLEEAKDECVQRATYALSHKPNFSGVCVDTFPKSIQRFMEIGINEVVQQLIDDTIAWM